MKKSLFLAAVCLALLQFACTSEQGPRANTESRTVMTDSDLKNRIEASVNSDSELAAVKLNIDANADRNIATLSGTVESESMRNRAVDLAKGANPGIVIEDKIDVKPRALSRDEYTEEHAKSERSLAKEAKENIGNSLDDAWIHSKVVAKLIGNSRTPEHRINVDVANNVVTLRGTVETMDEKAEAQRVTTDTLGVKRVINQLKVVSKRAS